MWVVEGEVGEEGEEVWVGGGDAGGIVEGGDGADGDGGCGGVGAGIVLWMGQYTRWYASMRESYLNTSTYCDVAEIVPYIRSWERCWGHWHRCS